MNFIGKSMENKSKIKGFEYFRVVVAKWIVVNLAARIHSLAVLALCLEVADLYHQSVEAEEDE